jgi:lysophospholipase L1-like esterase
MTMTPTTSSGRADAGPRPGSRGKYLAFALAAIALASLATVAVLLAVDVYLHQRFSTAAAVNVWGYRGPTLGRKAAGEWRAVFLGGSTAFGYGVTTDRTIPAFLERLLTGAHANGRGPVRVVNLGYNNEGAYALLPNLRDYLYLDYDAAIFYVGYNDLGGRNTTAARQQSAVFRLTGYFPILPIVLQEKAMVLRSGGQLEAAYRGEKTQFEPNLAERSSAAALEAAARISTSLERQLGRLTGDVSQAPSPGSAACGPRWAHYCEAVVGAAEWTLARGKRVVVVNPPYLADAHVEQEAALAARLRQRFGSDPRLVYVNLGRALDVRDHELCYDGMHLTARGNERIARQLVPVVRNLLR